MSKLSSVDPLSLAAQLGGKHLPPVHQWNPEFCGDMDLHIDRSGIWFYKDSPIGRHRLVKLLSSVMRRDEDGDYYLVTPVEKLRIQVDDVPFLAVELESEGQGQKQKLLFRTNVDDIVIADEYHPIRVAEDLITGEPSPYVMIRDGLEALLSRSVFYRLVDLAVELDTDGETVLGVWSCNIFFKLGLSSDG
jgi:hypothetical protein